MKYFLVLLIVIACKNCFAQSNNQWLTIVNIKQNTKLIKIKFENKTSDTIFIPRLNGEVTNKGLLLKKFTIEGDTIIIDLSDTSVIHFSEQNEVYWHTEGEKIDYAFFLAPTEKVVMSLRKTTRAFIEVSLVNIIISKKLTYSIKL